MKEKKKLKKASKTEGVAFLSCSMVVASQYVHRDSVGETRAALAVSHVRDTGVV